MLYNKPIKDMTIEEKWEVVDKLLSLEKDITFYLVHTPFASPYDEVMNNLEQIPGFIGFQDELAKAREQKGQCFNYDYLYYYIKFKIEDMLNNITGKVLYHIDA